MGTTEWERRVILTKETIYTARDVVFCCVRYTLRFYRFIDAGKDWEKELD